MKTKGKYYKLSVLLLKSNKILFLLMMISSVMGFSFLGMASSLSQSIIETKQKSTMDTYGSFISVVSDVDEEKIENIIDECSDYECLPFEITGSIEYNNKVIAMGNIDENAGQSLGIKLLNGTWPKESNEIVIENYLTDVFRVNESRLPCKIKLQVEEKEKEYIITGVINNYSSMLSINCDLKTKTNPYPYMLQADYLVMSSDYEGFPLVYYEAAVLGKKIITTIDVSDDYLSMKQIAHIVSKNEDEMLNQIKSILKEKNDKTIKIDFNEINKKKVEKLEEIIEEVI